MARLSSLLVSAGGRTLERDNSAPHAEASVTTMPLSTATRVAEAAVARVAAARARVEAAQATATMAAVARSGGLQPPATRTLARRVGSRQPAALVYVQPNEGVEIHETHGTAAAFANKFLGPSG
eukprot:6975416-Prymnesium_polylepis.1